MSQHAAGSAESLVVLEITEGVATIRLNRPKVNAINAALLADLLAVAREVEARDDVRAAVVYGGERAFAAGADIVEMQAASESEMAALVDLMHEAFDAVAAIGKPVVAAITGYALGGGCELALACDLRIAADSARLGQPEVLLGIIPCIGGTQRLPRVVGASKAKDLIFTGRFIEADEALAIGLVDRVVPADQVYAEALAWAGQFSNAAAQALRVAKATIDQGLETDLVAGLALEREAIASLYGTADRGIGMTSFVENGPGKAAFTGR